jgi:hypothetical protein
MIQNTDYLELFFTLLLNKPQSYQANRLKELELLMLPTNIEKMLESCFFP